MVPRGYRAIRWKRSNKWRRSTHLVKETAVGPPFQSLCGLAVMARVFLDPDAEITDACPFCAREAAPPEIRVNKFFPRAAWSGLKLKP